MPAPKRGPTEAQRAKERARRLLLIAKPLSFPCWYCGAKVGELCVTKHGKPVWQIGQMHEARLSRGKPPFQRYRRFGMFREGHR